VLVLTRRANQSIMIGHDIVVTVLEVRGDQVRLGIKAPRSIDVHREEVFAALQQANKAAAVSPSKEALESLDALRPKSTTPDDR
jgi:carbon storage regulator